MRRTFLAMMLAGLAMAACSLPIADKAADAKAQALFEQIRTGADLAANPDLGPDLRTPPILEQLAAVKAILPPGAPDAAVTRSWNVSAGTGGSRTTLVHAYRYPGRTVLAQTVLTKVPGGAWQIIGFHGNVEAAAGAAPPGGGAAAGPSQTT